MVDAETPEGEVGLIVRRAAGGVIYSHAISFEQEYRILQAAHEFGVKVPKPYGRLDDLSGSEALVMQRLDGEGDGYQATQNPEFQATREALPGQMEELAKIHAVPLERLPSLPGASSEPAAPRILEDLEGELDLLEEPHPGIELDLHWLREHQPESHGIVLNHGDFRLSNLIVNEEGLMGVIDWEFAHLSDPAEDLAWPLVRAWRFGAEHLRLGGVGEPEPYLERYNELTGRGISLEDLFFWEVLGNVRWNIIAFNQAARHLSGQTRSVELAILGRLAAEAEYETLRLLERRHLYAGPAHSEGASRSGPGVPEGRGPPRTRRLAHRIPHEGGDERPGDPGARARARREAPEGRTRTPLPLVGRGPGHSCP